MPVDLLYLAHNRLEFTRESMAALIAHTDWLLVRSITIYDDNSTDGTREHLESLQFPVPKIFRAVSVGSPVAIMNDFVAKSDLKPELFGKIDSDTMVPIGWLTECLRVLDENPAVDLLGIEPCYPVATMAPYRAAEPANHIGGIGLMRGRAFQYGLPRPDGRFGFTAWQDHEKGVVKAWLNPALPVFLLDRMPTEPWKSLSDAYVAQKWQRPWQRYTLADAALWDWWRP